MNSSDCQKLCEHPWSPGLRAWPARHRPEEAILGRNMTRQCSNPAAASAAGPQTRTRLISSQCAITGVCLIWRRNP